MDVTTPEQAKIAEQAGAVAVMALERIPADIRAAGGVARMSDPKMIRGIQEAVSIPVMAKVRIGHFVEAQILEALEIDYIDESEVLSPADGVFQAVGQIGDQVREGDVAGYVDGVPMRCMISGVLRGILPDGTVVHKGMKSGDVDPRCAIDHCFCASDKALAVGGGVLEAILNLSDILVD